MTTVQPHVSRAHARLAPSAAYRWMNCPGSVRESAGMEERSSYSNEGTAAHEYANYVLEQNIDAEAHRGQFIDIDPKPDARGTVKKLIHVGAANGRNIWEIDDEMVEAVGIYVEHVRSLIKEGAALCIVDIEQRLSMEHVHPAIFGTGDAVVYDVEEGHLHVCDFKYGKGITVSPFENPQLLLYGAGAARRYAKHKLNKITLHIVQPRTPGEAIKSWQTDLLDLFDFEDEAGQKARATDEPDAPLIAGDWCTSGFCPVRATCHVRRDSIVKASQAEIDEFGAVHFPAIAELTPEQRGVILRQADQIFAFVKAVQEAEHANALAGNPPAGFKLVTKRAVRKWGLEDGLAEELATTFDRSEDEFYAEPKLLSPAQVEKMVGKKAFAQAANLVVQKSSGVNLVPAEDPRPAVAMDALAEFSAVNEVEN